MSIRVYLLIDTIGGKTGRVAEILRGKTGVSIVDLPVGRPDVIVMVQASSRQRLAELTNQAIASVESFTENIKVLPVQGNGEIKP